MSTEKTNSEVLFIGGNGLRRGSADAGWTLVIAKKVSSRIGSAVLE
jgi:hypothetical protein